MKHTAILCVGIIIAAIHPCLAQGGKSDIVNVFDKDVEVTEMQRNNMRSAINSCLSNPKNDTCMHYHQFVERCGYNADVDVTDSYLDYQIATNMSGTGQIEEVFTAFDGVCRGDHSRKVVESTVKKIRMDNDIKSAVCEHDNAQASDVRLDGQTLIVKILGCQYTPYSNVQTWIAKSIGASD